MIKVTDLRYEPEKTQWIQKVSSYYKVRISQRTVIPII